MRTGLVTGVLLTAVFVPSSSAHGDQTPPVLSTLDTTPSPALQNETDHDTPDDSEPESESQPTTSEFGTETEIEISLNDEGIIIPNP